MELNKIYQGDLDRLYWELNNIPQSEKKFFHPHEFDMRTLEGLLNEKGNDYYLFYNGWESLGYGMLRTFNKFKIQTMGGIIWRRYRGNGYGEKLMRKLIKKSRGDRVRLSVYPDNKVALKIYEKLGFRVLNVREDGQLWMELEK